MATLHAKVLILRKSTGGKICMQACRDRVRGGGRGGGGVADLALPHGHVQGVSAIQELHNLALRQRDAVLHRLLALPALPVGLALHKHTVARLW